MSDYKSGNSAFREQSVEIKPIEFCASCPRRGDCNGPAVTAIDTYTKVNFWTVSEDPNDPEAFAMRRYVDAEGGESGSFTAQERTDGLIQACEKPVKIRQGFLKPSIKECGAAAVLFAERDERLAAIEAKRAEDRANSVYLTKDEANAYIDLDPTDRDKLSDLPQAELNKLILFVRKYPKRVALLHELASATKDL